MSKQNTLDNYPIFMAIAEDIGYDAVGRSSDNNERVEIGKGREEIIEHIYKTEL